MFKKLTIAGMALFTFMAVKVSCNAGELLQTTNFRSGVSLPWVLEESNENNAYSFVKNEKYVVHMDMKGYNKWDVQIKHKNITLQTGHQYTVKFSVTSDKSTKFYAKIGDSGEPYGEAWNNNWNPFNIIAGQQLSVTQTFIPQKDYKNAEFAFHLGGELAGSLPVEIQFISMSLTEPGPTPSPTPTPTPPKDIRVNQLGYLPSGAKKATLNVEGSAVEPLDWQLKDSSGAVVASGKTIPFEGKGPDGIDSASGERVHIINFSQFTEPGKGYRLVAGEANSYPFDIGPDIYSNMKHDALKYFYHARSGVDIRMPYCVESKWARQAGHTNDMAKGVSGRGYTGPASIDGTGGWYDSSDYGKYTVGGGFSLWMLQNLYEHSKNRNSADNFSDGKLNIPESGNGINDLLDETRWEMEWMLKMQIPEGYDRAGMAVSKITSENWPLLGLLPHNDSALRVYYPPTTAATLNLAACAAQAARIWKDIDPVFADKCLSASERAYTAAKANPAIFSPYVPAGLYSYNDNYVEDDFYWAACEMYITTSNTNYLADLKSYSKCFDIPDVLTGEFDGIPGCFDRSSTGGLGTISLALHFELDFDSAVVNIIKAADSYIEIQKKEGYGIPIAETTYYTNLTGTTEEINGYPWGSNSFVLNKAIIMAYAYDFSNDAKYLNGLTESMDYLMGRNAMVKCYVSGYGENPVQYPHHRYFAPQIDPILPSVPPGFLSSGPNSGCEDPWASGAGFKVNKYPAQKCYIDHVESWSTNEVNTNYNASLAWVAAYLSTSDPKFKVIEDINMDGSVNMADAVLVARVFGSTKDTPDFDKKCDLNNDGTINVSDIVKLALKFGYTYNI
ncbi:MAG TPA: glycoside hydrolase family 9 protein [Pseudobacteroides sp.]|uniref:glycoside hydrolase family 9 protein n=1 Tax=Pseudobacteroides sp. TaxID=1968840 RepID=UPI002F93F583